MTEKPQRIWKVFLLDMFKQFFGQFIIHWINVFFSIYVAANIRSKSVHSDQCSWYFTAFLIDLFPGLLLIWTFATVTERLFIRYDVHSLIPGNYVYDRNEEIFIRKCDYVKQVLVWTAILLLAKLILILLYIPLIDELNRFSGWSLGFLEFSPDFKLFFVLICFPLTVNVLLFWISDNLLKKKYWTPEEETLRKSFYTHDDNEETQLRYVSLSNKKGGLIGGKSKGLTDI